jgi:hypothetical protein
MRFLLLLAALAAVLSAACIDMPATLTKLLEARRLASEMRVEFTHASDAANRAVMADTDEASTAAADEAKKARLVVERDLQTLQSILQTLGYTDDLHHLGVFKARFEEYRRLDDEILPLAVENTNLKAQRLSFGPAREAADAVRASLEAAVRSSHASKSPAEILAAKAGMALFEIQVMQAPHIAESDDAAMTQMEGQMAASEAAARQAIGELGTMLGATAKSALAAAATSLDRFKALNAKIVSLSRRNTNVRSLALSLGRKRMMTAECDDHLRALEQALASHEFQATR